MMATDRKLTKYAYNYQRKLSKAAVRKKVFITLDKEDVLHGKVAVQWRS